MRLPTTLFLIVLTTWTATASGAILTEISGAAFNAPASAGDAMFGDNDFASAQVRTNLRQIGTAPNNRKVMTISSFQIDNAFISDLNAASQVRFEFTIDDDRGTPLPTGEAFLFANTLLLPSSGSQFRQIAASSNTSIGSFSQAFGRQSIEFSVASLGSLNAGNIISIGLDGGYTPNGSADISIFLPDSDPLTDDLITLSPVAVPEPGSAGILLVAACWMGRRLRRRK